MKFKPDFFCCTRALHNNVFSTWDDEEDLFTFLGTWLLKIMWYIPFLCIDIIAIPIYILIGIKLNNYIEDDII